MAGKNYLFLTLSKTSGRVSSQQGVPIYNLQPDLRERFSADVCPDINGQFGCGHRAIFRPSVG